MTKPRSRFHRALVATFWLASILAAIVFGSAVASILVAVPADGRPAHGLFVGGRIPPEQPSLGTWLEGRRRALAGRRVVIVDGLDTYETTLGELGVEIDVAATMDRALRPGRDGGIAERARALLLARRGLLDVPLQYSVDPRRAEAGLKAVADRVARPPVNAALDLTAHARIPDIPGVALDVEATMVSVVRGVMNGDDAYLVATQDVPAEVTEDDLKSVDVTKVVGSFDTTFSVRGVGARRAQNIELAARAIDGIVLKPGQSFSFNTVVGRRTLDRGYTWAPVIVGDELQEGIGGGICQVASTVYAAALYSAMQITERWAHGRPSSYTRFGLDATVSYPSKDLRFVNSLPYSIILHVHFPEGGKIRAEVLGGEPVAKVRYRYGVSQSSEFLRRIVTKPWLRPGTVMRKQKGIKGYSVVSMVELDFGDRVDKRSYYSEYRPTPEILWVAPGYDESALPELPAGAKGVEGQLTETDTSADPAG